MAEENTFGWQKYDHTTGSVVAVSRSKEHVFSKANVESIVLLKSLGVEGDAHMGKTVQHLSRIARNPEQPNLRQIHLIHSELFAELKNTRYNILPGQVGENITTYGIDLLGLPTGTELHIGETAVVGITGLRNPCAQLDDFRPGLMNALLDRAKDGSIIRKGGVMGVVLEGGTVKPGDRIQIVLPQKPYRPLQIV